MILKLKRTPGIFLVGFMGSGKSTVGEALSEELGWSFFDLDHDIERAAGKSVSEIFDQDGEEEFRRLELDALRKRVHIVQGGRPQVIALGGGAFVNDENIALAVNNGVTIWLDCPFDMIERRVAEETHRPLARDPERMRRLFEERKQAYGRADYRIPIDCDDPAHAVQMILGLPLFRP